MELGKGPMIGVEQVWTVAVSVQVEVTVETPEPEHVLAPTVIVEP